MSLLRRNKGVTATGRNTKGSAHYKTNLEKSMETNMPLV
jgi:hypothetical protein